MAKSTYYAAMKSINQGDKYSKLKEAIKRICIDNKGKVPLLNCAKLYRQYKKAPM